METSEFDRLLDPEPMPLEMGVERLGSGVLHVAVRTLMPGCSGAMFTWWFGWGCDTQQYAWWHPGDHVSSRWDAWQPGRNIGSEHVVEERLGVRDRLPRGDPVRQIGAVAVVVVSVGSVIALTTASRTSAWSLRRIGAMNASQVPS